MRTLDGKNSAAFGKGPITFTLDEEQVAKANIWAKKHKCSAAGSYGSAGDKFSYRFVPSGIGDFVTMRCSCGKEVDLTGEL